jgi:protein SCO1/2
VADERAALARSQAAIGQALPPGRFIASDGQPVALASLRGRPLVLALIYTGCSHTCPLLTRYIQGVAGQAHAALGRDAFRVAFVGFDTAHDSPARMASFARAQGLDGPGTLALSTDAATLRGLATGLGFTWFPSAKGFDHLAQTTVIDAEGRVYRQIYGNTFSPPLLVEPLKDLILGRPSPAADLGERWLLRLKLFCTVYDPRNERYTFNYSILFTVFTGVLSLGAAAIFIVHAWRHGRRPPSPRVG